MIIYLLIIIIFLVVIFGLISYVKVTNLKDEENKLLSSYNKINEIITNKEENIIKILDIIKIDKFNKKLYHLDDLIDKENMLFNLYWDLKKYIEDEKINNNDLNDIIYDINKYEDELEGLKDFYNSNSNVYNQMYNKKPFVILYKIMKLNKKKTFKSQKIESYDILKD